MTCLTVKFRLAQNRAQLANGVVLIRDLQPTLNEYVSSEKLHLLKLN